MILLRRSFVVVAAPVVKMGYRGGAPSWNESQAEILAADMPDQGKPRTEFQAPRGNLNNLGRGKAGSGEPGEMSVGVLLEIGF